MAARTMKDRAVKAAVGFNPVFGKEEAKALVARFGVVTDHDLALLEAVGVRNILPDEIREAKASAEAALEELNDSTFKASEKARRRAAVLQNLINTIQGWIDSAKAKANAVRRTNDAEANGVRKGMESDAALLARVGVKAAQAA